jgi:uncharacterized membrane protein
MFFGFLGDFVHRYFIVPGYDWVDTPTYGLALGLLVIFAVIPFLKRIGLRIDRVFFIGVGPFLFFGATARELVDRGLGVYGMVGGYPENFWLVSPWIFFTMFFLTLLCLIFGLLVNRAFKSIGYHMPMFAAGSVLCAYNLYLVLSNAKHLVLFFYVIFVFTAFMFFVFFISKFRALSFLKNEFNLAVVGAHLLDASATFIGVDFLGFGEQHVLPSLLIEKSGTAAIMFPLKLAVLLPALYVVEKELRGDDFSRRFMKFVFLVLGLGPALRDITMMIL